MKRSLERILTLAFRVIRQVSRDRRTVALLLIVPILVLVLGFVLFRSEPAPVALGVVTRDTGPAAPDAGILSLGLLIFEELSVGGHIEVKELPPEEDIEKFLESGAADGVLVLPVGFSANFFRERRLELDLRLEGTSPGRNALLTGQVTGAAARVLAGLAAGGGMAAPAPGGGGMAVPPVTIAASYLHAGPEFDTMDLVAPAYIAILAMFFVFLLTCVSFLRERTQGTMERLLATPATRREIVLGYMSGLGLFALFQGAVITFFTVWALRIHYLCSLGLLFIVVALLAAVGVSLGILASAFARNEFQVVQFIPLLIIPQALLGGTFWAVEDMPAWLKPVSYLMPITYANRALREIMLKGWGLLEIWPSLAILAGFAVLLTLLGVLTMRREIA